MNYEEWKWHLFAQFIVYIQYIYFPAKRNINHQQGCVRMNQSDRRFISLFSLKANCFSSSLKAEIMKNKRIIVEW